MTVVANAEFAQSYSAQANTGRFLMSSRTARVYADIHRPLAASRLRAEVTALNPLLRLARLAEGDLRPALDA